MKILITGGAGFIGSNFIYYLHNKYPHYQIVCMDKLSYAGNISTLAPLLMSKRIRFVYADICDRRAVNQCFIEEKPDVVINFAAESHVDRSIENPEVFLQTNIIGTSVLMDACKQFGISRFHQISTDEVYGDLPLDDNASLFSESSPLRASSPYSSSKASADLLVLAYHRTYGLPVTISRCSNNYGPYQFPEKLIPLMIIKALHNNQLPIYGQGLNVRDWIHVEDHCIAIDLIIHQGKCGTVYNIGGNSEKQNIEVVKQICNLMNKPQKLISFVADRKGHDLRYGIDSSKMNFELGWKPKISFDDGLKQTVSWYLSHKSWWESIINGDYLAYNSLFVNKHMSEI